MPINITEEFVRNLIEQNAALIAQVANLSETVESLNQTIKDLQEQLSKNSKNSSKPPSSDGLKKPPVNKDRSLRGKSGKKQGTFPKDIKATVQYGKNLQALVVALNTVGAVSVNRTHEILSSVFNIPLATGTIKNMVTRCAGLLSDTYEKIRKHMIALDLIHCDETGTRVDGKTWWVHNASDALFTFLSINPKRGWLGMNDAGILPKFHEITVHDCWGSYWKYSDCLHAICCTHLLRELNGIEENHPEQTWVKEFKNLLLEMKKVKDKAVAQEKDQSIKFSR